MDVLLQRHCAKHIYVVPDGLRELMSDISREVLRSQPEQLYTFIADYLDALMITRENARVAARLVAHISEISETIVELLIRTGMTREEADEVAKIIQNAFRRYLQRKERQKIAEVYGFTEEEVNEEEEAMEGEEYEEERFVREVLLEAEIDEEIRHKAARIIQAAYRKFKRRQELEKDLLYGMVDWRIAAKHTISLYRKAGVSEWEANRAATLIQAAYKGYYTRRIMRKLLEKQNEESEANIYDEGSSTSSGRPSWELDTKNEDEEDDEETKKSVRINFDTVIPHVDFDEPTVIGIDMELEEKPPSRDGDADTAPEEKTLETILEVEEEVTVDEPPSTPPPQPEEIPPPVEEPASKPVEPEDVISVGAPPEETPPPPPETEEAPPMEEPLPMPEETVGEVLPIEEGLPILEEQTISEPPESPMTQTEPLESPVSNTDAEVTMTEEQEMITTDTEQVTEEQEV